MINSIGDILGYVAPQMVGVLRDGTGSYEVLMIIAGLSMLVAGICIVLSVRAEVRLSMKPSAFGPG
jgi:MFS transporter, ACS family, tartrate transporter